MIWQQKFGRSWINKCFFFPALSLLDVPLLFGYDNIFREGKVTPGKSILIVEDEAGPRESLRMILKPFYNILTASDGEQAIRILQAQKVDLVTLDLNMPGMMGIDVLKEIKRLKPEVEVVIITALVTLPNAQQAIQHGASDFLSKPFHVSEVITVIKKSFERLESKSKNVDRADSIFPGKIKVVS